MNVKFTQMKPIY